MHVFKYTFVWTACHSNRLTGPYGEILGYAQGMMWQSWMGTYTFLKSAEMKIAPIPQSCHGYYDAGETTNGIYPVNISPPGSVPHIVDVHCDIVLGGWTVSQLPQNRLHV